ncbi:MAG: PAS domain S-box protein [Armatimonadota bacterium]
MVPDLLVVAGPLVSIIAIILASWHIIKSDHYKQAYEAGLQMQALAQHYQSLIQNAGDIILLTDTDLRIVDANELAAHTYGYAREKLLRMSIYDLVSGGQKDASHAGAERLKEGDILAFDSQHRKQNGELMYVEGRARKIDTAGKQYIQLIMRDTSDKTKEQIRLVNNEKLLTELLNHLSGMTYIFNLQGEFVYMNRALAEFLGVDSTNRDTWKNIDHPLLPLLYCDEKQKQELARYQSTATEIQLADGSQLKHYLLRQFVVPQPDEPDWLGGIVLNVSQSKHSELELQRITLIYALLSQINEVISKATDTYGLYQTVCDVAAEYGKSTLAWIGSYDEHVSTLTPLAWSGSPREYVNIVTGPASGLMRNIDPVFTAISSKTAVYANNIASGAYSPGETLLNSKNIHSAAAVPVLDGDSVIGVLALYQQEPEFFGEQELRLLDKIGLNISYGLDSIRKRQQQHQLEEIVVNSPAVAFRWMNVKGWPVLYVSDNITQLGFDVGYFKEARKPYADIIHPDDITVIEEAFAAYIAEPNGIYNRSYRIIDQSGGTRWVDERSWLVDDNTDHSQYVMGIVMDITLQKLVEQNQQESEQRYHAIFNNLHTVMIVVDPATGSIVDANPAAVDYYGWPKEQLLTMVMSNINTLPADHQSAAMANVVNQTQNHFRFMHRRANGKTSDVEVYSTPIVVQGRTLLYSIIHDVTDRVTAEEMRQREEQRQIQSSKMETIGQLSSGIAHDFNNLLTVITGFIDIMMAESDANSPFYSEMTEVKNASDKAASLTKQLLAFSRKQTLEKKPVNVNTLITSNKKMISRLIGEDIKVDMTLAPGVLMASVDEGQMDQVILNLATNARDAMPNGGKLRIVTDVINITKDDVTFGTDSSEGKYIKITVADTGTGMDDATSSRIFEPFYTTKTEGKGTGLGLSTCYGIMKQHEGWISVSSTKGIGTEFYLYLPALDVTQDDQKHVATAASLPQGVGHTVLLVEDELAVQRMSIKVLERFGYVVIPASDGVEALSIYQNEPSRFDLVLSDVVMPNMDGLTLINHIQDINPSQKIILNSGYTDDKVDWGSIENRNITFLHKPFTVEKLITTVHQVITGT